jgi:Xaa-Pro aminopeptidase
MKSHFTSEFFAGNRTRLRELFTGTAPIVITANGLLQRGGDNAFPFAQDANFWYLTGLDEPDLVLVMERDREYLIVPGRSVSREAFDGALDAHELTARSGVKHILDGDAGWEELEKRVKKVKHVATIAPPPAYVDSLGLFTNPARATLTERLKNAKPELELLDLTPHLVRMRMIKQPAELAALQNAIDITAASLKTLMRPASLARYRHEYELEADLGREFRRRGAAGHSFAPIVAAGQRACTLHNVANNGSLQRGELMVVDVGAEVEHYAADITRTVALGNASKRQRQVHEAVLAVQEFAMSQLKPGASMRAYEQAVEHFMGEKLRELGLIKSISHKAVRRFYPHATSHFLGLNVHDVGEYNRPLEVGAVLTVEPGIYIPKEGIGVRIEDDVLITPRGIKNLSAKLPRELS